ncbi:MAG TPA: OmpA family protein [Elusimicrobiota bacterium]|nr:OmpA family protein [Elusimicrobiota bacterium]
MNNRLWWCVPLVLMAGCQSARPLRRGGAPAPSAAAGAAGILPSAGFKAFAIYTDRAPRRTHYAPSGYMGDSDLTMSGAYTETPHGQGPCLRINYQAGGPKGWAGIYWQDPANNWGDVPGRAGYDLRGATKLSFWARGENGGERVHEFRLGGIVGQYPDSDVASLPNIKLSKEWKQYHIDLTRKDLRHIIGGFGFFVNKAENPGGEVFYLDDIFYEGPQGLPTVAESTGAVTSLGNAAAAAAPAPEPKPVPSSTKEMNVKETDAGLKVSFSSQFLFAPGKANLQPGSGKILDQLVGLLSAYPNNGILIEGHTDNTGSAQFNLKLSELRATTVRDYLIMQGGFAASRFKVVGYGDTRPVAGNDTAAGRAMNRRVEATILRSPNP